MRVVVADDSTLLREGLVRLLREVGFDVVGQAANAEELLRLVRSEQPDVAVVDIRMPPTRTDEGLKAAEQIRGGSPGVAVLILSEYLESHYAIRLIQSASGGIGYLLKERVSDVQTFADAVRRVAEGEFVIDPAIVTQLVGRRRPPNPLDELTRRELEVLGLMAEGRTNRSIGEKLFLSANTVESHVRNILSKLDLEESPGDNRRVLAVITYLRRGANSEAAPP
ncbi:MAG TPA: response regulator transcription factor [Candidatus Dormibacteraeota bacterium]|nr:response regulator transcription factor [Candidatus Dormibacteraeota bacterium]